MTANKPTMDLRGEQPAWRKRREEQRKAEIAAVEASKPADDGDPTTEEIEAFEASLPQPQKPLLKRKMGIDISYTNPDSGEVQRAQIVSLVPDSNGLDAIAATERRLLRFAPPSTCPEWQVLRARCLADCYEQIDDAPDWVMDRLAEDGGFLLELHGRLREHAEGYFRGNPVKGKDDQVKPRLVIGPLSTIA